MEDNSNPPKSYPSVIAVIKGDKKELTKLIAFKDKALQDQAFELLYLIESIEALANLQNPDNRDVLPTFKLKDTNGLVWSMYDAAKTKGLELRILPRDASAAVRYVLLIPNMGASATSDDIQKIKALINTATNGIVDDFPSHLR